MSASNYSKTFDDALKRRCKEEGLSEEETSKLLREVRAKREESARNDQNLDAEIKLELLAEQEMSQSCSNCKYWEENRNSFHAEENRLGLYSECLRHPPMHHFEEYSSRPETSSLDWCGDWKGVNISDSAIRTRREEIRKRRQRRE